MAREVMKFNFSRVCFFVRYLFCYPFFCSSPVIYFSVQFLPITIKSGERRLQPSEANGRNHPRRMPSTDLRCREPGYVAFM